MAKKSKKDKSVSSKALAGVAGSDVLGTIVGKLLTEWAQGKLAVPAFLGGASTSASSNEDDPAAQALRALQRRGRMTVAELAEASGVELTPLLQTLGLARQFRLIDFVEDDGVITLTEAGEQAARGLDKGGIRRKAAKLLKSGGDDGAEKD